MVLIKLLVGLVVGFLGLVVGLIGGLFGLVVGIAGGAVAMVVGLLVLLLIVPFVLLLKIII